MRILTIIIYLFPAMSIAGNIFLEPLLKQKGDTTSLTFVEVRNSESLNKYQLFTEVSNYFNTREDIESIIYSDSIDWIQVTSKSTLTNNLVGKVGHPEAIIDYTLKIEFKDNKYRCSFKDLFHTPMRRNRYGIFKELKSSKKAINGKNFKVNKSAWKKIFKHMSGFTFDYIDVLNKSLRIKEKLPENTESSDW